MDSLVIRNATESDAVTLCAAEQETALIPGLLISRPNELQPESFARKISALYHDGLYLVAERGGKAVGHALLEPLGMEALSHVMSLTIVVHPGHVEQGIGKLLMSSLLEWARTRPGLLKIELRVRGSNNRARRLYERFGFIEEGRLEKRIRLPDGSFVADICMAWFLTA